MNLTINNVTIELNQDTVTQIKKAIMEFEKSDEIQVGEQYFSTNSVRELIIDTWYNDKEDNYRKGQDNCCPQKNYTEDQAKEYFDKRDARRAAETKLRKIIGDMNKKDGFVAKFCGSADNAQSNYFGAVDTRDNKLVVESHVWTLTLPLWRYSSKETAQFINENHADLLKAYLNG